MAVSTAPLCLLLLLLGVVCLANAATTPVLPDLVDAAKFLYDSLSQAQTQQDGGVVTLGEPEIFYCWYEDGLLICEYI